MYPSDLTDAQWARLERLLKEPRGQRHAGGRPRKHELRRVVEALLYVVKTGCQWRQLPSNFPPWKTVHEHFRAWRDSGVWERVGKTLREQGRSAKGRNAVPSVAIIDSQSAKTALKGGGAVTTRARKSRDASGTSRSIQKETCWR
jgi:transposase